MQLNQPMKGTSLRERREYLWLMKLRTVPQFAELVKRFARGQSVWATTVWFMSQENRGELSNCSFEMTRKYLTTLSIRIKEQNDRLPKMDMSDFHKVGVVAGVESKLKAAVKGMPDPAGADHISKVLTEALEKVNAMTILKYAFALQQQRVIDLMEIEKKAKVPFPHTNKAVELLKDIGDRHSEGRAGRSVSAAKAAWAGAAHSRVSWLLRSQYSRRRSKPLLNCPRSSRIW